MSTIKYYGIDIGDGESAVATVDEKGAFIPRVLMLGNTKSMLSVVGELNGEPIIGDQAMLQPGVGNIRTRFKSRYLQDPEASRTIASFAQGLREKLRNDIDGSTEPHIALGCPAGWSSNDRQRYADIVGGAGFPNLHTVAESRAAFLYAHYDTDIGLSVEELSQPTLVIDIGSSTTDFAYIVDGKESNVGIFGNVYLGGGLLDQVILEDAVEQSPKRAQIKAVFDQYPSWRSLCELAARKAKEQYFSKEADWADTPLVSKTGIFADVNASLSLTISLDAQRMARLLETPIEALGNMTFPERLKKSLDMAAEYTAAHPPTQLILTGGASRMAFFQKICRDTFPGARIIVCREPEFSIARGLGIAARIDYRLSYFRRVIEDYFESGDLRRDIQGHLHTLQAKICPVLQKRIMKNCVTPALLTNFTSTEQLENTIRDNIRREFQTQGRSPETDDIIAQWIVSDLGETQSRLDTLCVQNGVERTDLSLAKISVNVELGKMQIFSSLLFKLLPKGVLRFVHMLLPPQAAVEKALREALIDPKGAFAKSLASGIEAELRDQIRKNVEKVEIHIS